MDSNDFCIIYEGGFNRIIDKGCDDQYYYVCEFQCQSTTPLTSLTTCPPSQDYTLDGSVNKYYKPVKQLKTWHEAVEACLSEGTILVELRTTQEVQAVTSTYGRVNIQLELFLQWKWIVEEI